jgi:hypothetical protein
MAALLTRLFATCVALSALTGLSHAQMFITMGGVLAPGEGQKTPVPGATTETFNTQPLGNTASFSNAFGTYSGGEIKESPLLALYGGNTSHYITPRTNFPPLTFTPSTALTYFGLYWTTRDSSNTIRFFTGASGTTLIQSVTPTDVPGLNFFTGNFVNFFSPLGVSVTRIELDGSTIFDSDNHAYSTTVTSAPEPGTLALLGLGGAALLSLRRIRRRGSL